MQNNFTHSTSYTLHRIKRWILYSWFCLLLLFFTASYLQAQSPQNYGLQLGAGFSANALLQKGDTLFVGGNFDYIGPYTGSLVGAETGNNSIKKNFPVVNGTLNVAIADGAGGWFIGGNFSKVDGYTRMGLAHLGSDKKLDPNWTIGVVKKTSSGSFVSSGVEALLIVGDTLFVGGSFTHTSVNGTTLRRERLAAIKISTRTVINPWGLNQLLNVWDDGPFRGDWSYYDTKVTALAYSSGRLFVGGDFRTIVVGGTSYTKDYMAAFNSIDGSLVTGWQANITHVNNPMTGAKYLPVRALAVIGSYLYIGGAFTKVTGPGGNSGTNQIGISKVDISTGNPSGILHLSANTEWINCFKVVGNLLYVGGKFDNFNGNGLAHCFACYNTVTGNIDPNLKIWPADTTRQTSNPSVYNYGEVYSIEIIGTTAYLGGDFKGLQVDNPNPPFGVLKLYRRNLAAIDLTNNTIQPWAPLVQTGAPVRSLLNIGGSELLVGGSFTSAGGWPRANLAAYDLKQDVILPFEPRPESYVNALLLSPTKDTLYIGGNFTTLSGVNRGYTGAVKLSTGALLPWATATGVGGGVQAMALDPVKNILYVGGKFSSLAGQTKKNLAALNARTGALLPGWTANVEPINSNVTPVRDLVLSVTRDTLLVGGRFDNINLINGRKNLAAFTTTLQPADATASLLGWNFPVTELTTNPEEGVYSLVREDNRLYIGGSFGSITDENGVSQARTNLAMVDLSSNTLNTGFKPLVESGGLFTMQILGNNLYLGGDFGRLNGVTTSYAGAVDKIAGFTVAAWKPFPAGAAGMGSIETLLVTERYVYLGGSHERMNQDDADAVYHLSTAPSLGGGKTLPVVWGAFTGSMQGPSASVLQWYTLQEVNTKQFIVQRSTNGTNWQPIGVVPATHQPQGDSYRFVDRTPLAGKNYYRLQQVDVNNEYSYSNTINLVYSHSGANSIYVYPTVVQQGVVFVQVGTDHYSAAVYNLQGHLIEQVRIKPGTNTIALGHYPKGAYLVQVGNTAEGTVQTTKIVVQ